MGFGGAVFEQLAPRVQGERAKIQFCGPAGADAVEAALKDVETATGRRSVLAFRGGSRIIHKGRSV